MLQHHLPAANTEGNPVSILIVEDDFALRETYTAIMKMSGYTVESVGTGPQAIRLLPSLRPSVVILDMNLSGGYSGTVVMAFIRSHHALQDTRVIVVSGKAGADINASFMKADRFLPKPVSIQDLIVSVMAVQGNNTHSIE